MRTLDRSPGETRWAINWRLIVAVWLAIGSWGFLIEVVRLTAHQWGG